MAGLRRQAESLPALKALAVVLAAGFSVRVAAMVAFRPAYLQHAGFFDAKLYVESAAEDLYQDPTRPVGYSAFLRVMSWVSSDLAFTIGVQHLLGLVTAVLLYLLLVKVGAAGWVAVTGAAAVALNGDQIFLEHTLLSEPVFTALLVAGLLGAVHCAARGSGALALGVGGLLGAATLTRTVGLFVIPLIAIWLLFCAKGGRRQRALLAGAVALAAVIVIGADATVRSSSTSYAGFGPSSGRSLYARVAQFAQCQEFDPPPGTKVLCERTPPKERPGASRYYSDSSLPATRAFGPPAGGDDLLRRFALKAIVNQPLDYARAVLIDLTRYVRERPSPRGGSGLGAEVFVLHTSPAVGRNLAEPVAEPLYGRTRLHIGQGAQAVRIYGQVVRPHGLLIVAAAALAILGVLRARGLQRAAVVLLAGTALVVTLMPVATLIFGARYLVPAIGPLAGAAALGASGLITPARARRTR